MDAINEYIRELMEIGQEAKWWIEGGASLSNDKFTRNHLMPDRQVYINRFRIKFDNTGVFMTAYKYDNPEQKVANLYGDFYLDFDSDKKRVVEIGRDAAYLEVKKDALTALAYLEVILGIPKDRTTIYFSGNKGLHITVPAETFGIEPHKNLNLIFRMIVDDISKLIKYDTLDLKIYDNRRLFRLPNSRHPSSGAYKIQITLEELRTLSLQEILQIAEGPRLIEEPERKMVMKAALAYRSYVDKLEQKMTKKNNQPINYSRTLDATPPCIEELLNSKVPEGQRNNTAAALTSFFKQRGFTEDEATSRLDEWNNTNCDPALEEQTIQTTVRSIYNGEYKYGCNGLAVLSTCDKLRCPLVRRKY